MENTKDDGIALSCGTETLNSGTTLLVLPSVSVRGSSTCFATAAVAVVDAAVGAARAVPSPGGAADAVADAADGGPSHFGCPISTAAATTGALRSDMPPSDDATSWTWASVPAAVPSPPPCPCPCVDVAIRCAAFTGELLLWGRRPRDSADGPPLRRVADGPVPSEKFISDAMGTSTPLPAAAAAAPGITIVGATTEMTKAGVGAVGGAAGATTAGAVGTASAAANAKVNSGLDGALLSRTVFSASLPSPPADTSHITMVC